MAQLLASYDLDGKRHRIELIQQDGGRLVVDRVGDGPAHVIAELGDAEGPEHAYCLLNGDGAYLERARGGERGLCRVLTDDPVEQQPLGQAA
jgi:hypothetical protein